MIEEEDHSRDLPTLFHVKMVSTKNTFKLRRYFLTEEELETEKGKKPLMPKT